MNTDLCPVTALGSPDTHVRRECRSDETSPHRHHGAIDEAEIEEQRTEETDGQIVGGDIRTVPEYGYLGILQRRQAMSFLWQHARDTTCFEAGEAFDLLVQGAQLAGDGDGRGRRNTFLLGRAAVGVCLHMVGILLEIEDHDGGGEGGKTVTRVRSGSNGTENGLRLQKNGGGKRERGDCLRLKRGQGRGPDELVLDASLCFLMQEARPTFRPRSHQGSAWSATLSGRH